MKCYLDLTHKSNQISYHLQVYTIAEDYYKGKPNRIGATGLEILYYYVPEGTVYIDSESSQKRLINEILTEQDGFSLVGEVLSQ